MEYNIFNRFKPAARVGPAPQYMASNDSSQRSAPESFEVLDTIPTNLLESFLPGFGVIRKVLLAATGADINYFVATAFLLWAFLSAGQYIGSTVSRLWMKWFSATILIQSNDKLFEQVMEWISKHRVTGSSRFLTAKTEDQQSGSGGRMRFGRGFNFGDWDVTIPPQYAPSYGQHWFWHQRTFFIFSRDRKKNELSRSAAATFIRSGGKSASDEEEIRITCFGKSTEPIKSLIYTCKAFAAERRKRLTVIRRPASGNYDWQLVSTRPSRPIDTVYMDQGEKTSIVDDITEFLDPKASKFYARRGIPYRRGYLFHGSPGTGKTSLSFALAGLFGLELFCLSISEPDMSDSSLSNLFSCLPARCIVLLEDVDIAGLVQKREEAEKAKEADKTKEEKEEKEENVVAVKKRIRRATPSGNAESQPSSVTLSGLLNAIDGVSSQEGRILIMTTNDPESLDAALIRPGRIDMQVAFSCASKEIIRQIFERMYSVDEDHEDEIGIDTRSKRQWVPEKIHLMAQTFAEALPDQLFTPAEVQGFLLSRRKDPQLALDQVETWRNELSKAKSLGMNVIGSV